MKPLNVCPQPSLLALPKGFSCTHFSLQEFIPVTTTFNRQFLDLLRQIFIYDPKQRITAKEALKHPWFKETLIDDGTEAYRIGMNLHRSVPR